VSQQQFIDTLQPPSAAGTPAQDALLALLDKVAPNSANPPVGGVGTATPASSIHTGTTAQDALSALVQNFDPAASKPSGTGNSAQDAVTALIKASGGSSSSPAGTLNSADLARAFALYQSQLEQQVLSSISATQSASI
jgi:hypothetical protein